MSAIPRARGLDPGAGQDGRLATATPPSSSRPATKAAARKLSGVGVSGIGTAMLRGTGMASRMGRWQAAYRGIAPDFKKVFGAAA